VKARRPGQAENLSFSVHCDEMTHQIPKNPPVVPDGIPVACRFQLHIQIWQSGILTKLRNALLHRLFLKVGFLHQNPVGVLRPAQGKNVLFARLERRILIEIGKERKCHDVHAQCVRLFGDALHQCVIVLRLHIRQKHNDPLSPHDIPSHVFSDSHIFIIRKNGCHVNLKHKKYFILQKKKSTISYKKAS